MMDFKELGEQMGINWEEVKFTPEDLEIGYKVELEHGTIDPSTNVTDDDPEMTAKIAWAHLNESPEYYNLLEQMEKKMEKEPHLKEAIYRLAQAEALFSEEELGGLEFEFLPQEQSELVQTLTPEEWEKLRYYQQNPPAPGSPEEAEYNALLAKAQGQIAASFNGRLVAATIEEKKEKIIDELYDPVILNRVVTALNLDKNLYYMLIEAVLEEISYHYNKIKMQGRYPDPEDVKTFKNIALAIGTDEESIDGAYNTMQRLLKEHYLPKYQLLAVAEKNLGMDIEAFIEKAIRNKLEESDVHVDKVYDILTPFFAHKYAGLK
jgi:hypothetical protein